MEVPVYSHKNYETCFWSSSMIERPDVLIIEGDDTLQLPSSEQIYVSDFTDFSIYVDARPKLVEGWYLERFKALLLKLAKDDPDNYYHSYTKVPIEAAVDPLRIFGTVLTCQTWKIIFYPRVAVQI